MGLEAYEPFPSSLMIVSSSSQHIQCGACKSPGAWSRWRKTSPNSAFLGAESSSSSFSHSHVPWSVYAFSTYPTTEFLSSVPECGEIFRPKVYKGVHEIYGLRCNDPFSGETVGNLLLMTCVCKPERHLRWCRRLIVNGVSQKIQMMEWRLGPLTLHLNGWRASAIRGSVILPEPIRRSISSLERFGYVDILSSQLLSIVEAAICCCYCRRFLILVFQVCRRSSKDFVQVESLYSFPVGNREGGSISVHDTTMTLMITDQKQVMTM